MRGGASVQGGCVGRLMVRAPVAGVVGDDLNAGCAARGPGSAGAPTDTVRGGPRPGAAFFAGSAGPARRRRGLRARAFAAPSPYRSSPKPASPGARHSRGKAAPKMGTNWNRMW